MEKNAKNKYFNKWYESFVLHGINVWSYLKGIILLFEQNKSWISPLYSGNVRKKININAKDYNYIVFIVQKKETKHYPYYPQCNFTIHS